MALLINVPTWNGSPAPNFSQVNAGDTPVLDTGSSKPKYNITPPIVAVQNPVATLDTGSGVIIEDNNPQLPVDQGGPTPPVAPMKQDLANLGELPTLVTTQKSSIGILIVLGLVGAAIYNARRKS